MTVPNELSRVDALGNGVASVFSFGFKIFLDTEIIVKKVLISDRTDVTTLVLNSDYTVAGAGDDDGGSVTLLAGALSALYALVLLRDVPVTQTLELTDEGQYFPDNVEKQLDRTTMMVQQQKEQIDRAIHMPVEVPTSVFNPELPADLVDSPGAALLVNASGDGFTAGVASLPTASVSAFIQTLLDDPSALVARQTLGFNGAGGTVGTLNLDALSVTPAKLASNSVTSAKIADMNVTTAKLDDAAVTLVKLSAAVAAALNPAGAVQEYAGSVLPAGWLWCDGDSVSRVTYADLFTAIGTKFGSVSGTTFSLPNMKGRTPRGIADYANAVGSGSASSNNATFTAHPYKQTGVRVRITGTLTGLATGTNYFIIFIDANTLAFATTLANALAGTKIVISGSNAATVIQWEDEDASTRAASTVGGNTGASVGTQQDASAGIAAEAGHTHSGTTGGTGSSFGTVGGSGSPADTHTHPFTTGAGSSHTHATTGDTRSRNVGFNYIIKT